MYIDMSRPQSVCFGQVRNKSESMFCFPYQVEFRVTMHTTVYK